MTEISKERIEKFWEKCGLENVSFDGAFFKGWQGYLGGELVHIPDLTSIEALGFLFKFAVPKLEYVILSNWNKKKKWNATVFDGEGDFNMADDKDFATALFLALEKAFDNL